MGDVLLLILFIAAFMTLVFSLRYDSYGCDDSDCENCPFPKCKQKKQN